ncbi:sodium channel subunit beta-1-like [Hypanus sabinus]|uniref:sodium channel subunit beta-1-like n=1 Tax=Hypanus sabinus TaxID=79690 RepID=UPI0028C47C1E|nr:sodium channel subunit beta-1-like [Hypanus sabinus]
MDSLKRILLYASLCLFWADCSNPGCVEVESDTEAVKDKKMKLRCISCKKRGETEASTIAEWYFRPRKNETFYKLCISLYLVSPPSSFSLSLPSISLLSPLSSLSPPLPLSLPSPALPSSPLLSPPLPIPPSPSLSSSPSSLSPLSPPFPTFPSLLNHSLPSPPVTPLPPLLHRPSPPSSPPLQIYEYSYSDQGISYGNFENRIKWGGSKDTADIQEATIFLHNVTFEDAGTYKCYFNRTFFFRKGEFIFFTQTNKTIELTVVAKANRLLASIIGEIMMYFLNVVLTLWLLAEMLYCYKKIAAAGEEAIQENASDYLAITSGSKEDCAGVQVEE